MHCVPLQISYKLSLSKEEIAEIVIAAKDWGFTPQKTIESILREWSVVRIDQRKEDDRLLRALRQEKKFRRGQ